MIDWTVIPPKPSIGLEALMPDALDIYIEREAFIREHHHLISPWTYSAREINSRNMLLAKRNWQRNTPNPNVMRYG